MPVQTAESGSDRKSEPTSDKRTSSSLQTIVTDSQEIAALDKDCLICMEAIGVNQEVIKMTCNQYFHHQCISQWLKKNSSCPHCRQIISDNPFLEPSEPLPTEEDLVIDSDRVVEFVLRGVPEEEWIDAIDEYERLVRHYIYNESDSEDES